MAPTVDKSQGFKLRGGLLSTCFTSKLLLKKDLDRVGGPESLLHEPNGTTIPPKP